MRGLSEDDPQRKAAGSYYKDYILWLTFGRNKIWSNVAMVLCTLAFAALAINEVRRAITSA
ncbi:hypothetical protein [Nocardioides sp. InS609-2]|uniref:hypothetical protein n=1 Tax=Nocardioides sp. InS609-2 TaxID=2760705 RepID=UPI0020BE39B9|nr:hypothetical protein [Nocardioides sp. InS609-2]